MKPTQKFILYLLSGIIPYLLMRHYFPEEKKIEKDRKPNPTPNSTDLRGGDNVPPKGLLSHLKQFVANVSKDRAAQFALASAISAMILTESNDVLVDTIMNKRMNPAFFGKKHAKEVAEIRKVAMTLKNSGVTESKIATEVNNNITSLLSGKFLASQLKAAILQIYKISNNSNKLFWIGVCILLLLNGTLGFTTIIFAIRELIKDGLLPPNILDHFD